MRPTGLYFANPFLVQSWHTAIWVDLSNPGLSGPAGYPRECFSLIGTGLTGLLSWASSNFIPENRPGLKNSLGG